MQDFVSGGYFLARRASTRPGLGSGLLPTNFVTLSDCLTTLVPSAWTLSWAQHEGWESKAQACGFDEERMQGLVSWCTEAFSRGEVRWPGVVRSFERARELKRDFFAEDDGFALLGIALSIGEACDFLAESIGLGENLGVVLGVEEGFPPEPGGEVLGYDVLGLDFGGGFHSYLCNGLERYFASTFGALPNPHGLFDSRDVATRCAAHAASSGAEPGVWRAWRVMLYVD